MIVAFIPARGGSIRVPNKNLQEVGGLSLVRRAIDCATAASADRVVVSTDADAIIVEAHADAEIHERPPNLAGPHAQIEDALGHWMRREDPVLAADDVVVLLQPTSPFRTPGAVQACVNLIRQGYDSALTISMGHRRNGRLRQHEDGASRVIWNSPNPLHRPRSQDVVKEPYENGAVYAFSAAHFRRTCCRMGGREAVIEIDPLQAFEIDTHEELTIARALATLMRAEELGGEGRT